jgi:hypothetical protein
MSNIFAVITLIFKIFNLFNKNKQKPVKKPPVKEKPVTPVVVEEVKPEPVKEIPKAPTISDKLKEAKDTDELLELMIENEEDELMREAMEKLRKGKKIEKDVSQFSLEAVPEAPKAKLKTKQSSDVKLTE